MVEGDQSFVKKLPDGDVWPEVHRSSADKEGGCPVKALASSGSVGERWRGWEVKVAGEDSDHLRGGRISDQLKKLKMKKEEGE